MASPRIFQQVKRRDPLVEVVLERLSEAIITGQLRPGDRLVETTLGKQLGVSRVPVREAMRHLEQVRLVDKIPNGGTFVSRLTASDIEELYTIRSQLEGLAARLVAAAHDPKAIAQLEAILEQTRTAAAANNLSAVIASDVDFHSALITLSGHKLLGTVWEPVSVRLRRFLLLKRQRLYRTLSEAVQMHEPIAQAIAAGDPVRAEAEAKRHVFEASQHLGDWDESAGEAPDVEIA